MALSKGGEVSFKTDTDGPFFNAYSSIAESFKNIEDALNAAQSVLQLIPNRPLTANPEP